MLLLTGSKDDSELGFPSDVDKEEWEEEQKVFWNFIALTVDKLVQNLLLHV